MPPGLPFPVNRIQWKGQGLGDPRQDESTGSMMRAQPSLQGRDSPPPYRVTGRIKTHSAKDVLMMAASVSKYKDKTGSSLDVKNKERIIDKCPH